MWPLTRGGARVEDGVVASFVPGIVVGGCVATPATLRLVAGIFSMARDKLINLGSNNE